MKRPKKRVIRRNAAAKALADPRFRPRIVKNPKTYTRKGRRPTDSGLFDSWAAKISEIGATTTPFDPENSKATLSQERPLVTDAAMTGRSPKWPFKPNKAHLH